MTAAIALGDFRRTPAVWPAVWIAALTATFVLGLYPDLLPWADKYPTDWLLPASSWIRVSMTWLISVFVDITRAISYVVGLPLQLAFAVLERGLPVGESITVPPVSWVGLTLAFVIAGFALGSWRLAALCGLCFLYLAFFGQWASAMRTLALVINCVVFGVIVGLLIGIWGYRSPRLNTLVIVPLLDLAQAMP